MRDLKAYWPLIAAAVLGLLILLLAEPASKWVESRGGTHSSFVIGRLTQAIGSVTRSHGSNSETLALPIAQPIDLYDGDRIQTSAGGQCTIILNSQDEIQIPPVSAVEFQLWNPADAASPVYINSLAGSLISKRAGIKGKAYLVKDGRLYLPGQTPARKPLALTVLRNAPLDLQVGGGTSGEFDADNTPTEDPADAVFTGADPETLSNDYIDETILAHQGQLQKCWLTRLKDAPKLKGQIVVQFEISKRGKVKEMRIADATLTDEILQKCVMSVIERVPFRPYKGSEISLSYPINFE